MPSGIAEFEFDVALSFAGEDRLVARQLADLLMKEGLRVFYDAWSEADLWGCDLYQRLDDIYSRKARFCVAFLSSAYAAKAWTTHELKSAQARVLQKRGEYILPVRLDDTEIPGIRPTLGYLDLRKLSIEKVAKLAIQKIRSAESRDGIGVRTEETTVEIPPKKQGLTLLNTGNLQIKRRFTDHDRDTFLEDAFEEIAGAFKASLTALEAQQTDIVGRFRRVGDNHFTVIIYRNGEKASSCGIRIDKMFGSSRIAYSSDPNSINSMNEAVCVKDDGNAIFLEPWGLSSMHASSSKPKKLSAHEAAALFWDILLGPLSR